MHILLLGATGGCGRWVARLATQRGHRVTAIVRSAPVDGSLDGATTTIGDVQEHSVLDRAMQSGVDGIISCLGIRRRDPRNPWSPVLGTHTLVGPVASALAQLVPASSVRRVIAVSSAGVADSAAVTTPILRWVFGHSNVRIAFEDLASMERIFAATSLDWVAVRPTRLVDGAPTGRTRECTVFRLGSSVSRGDVATWMLDAVESAEPIRNRTPMITAT